MISWFTNLLQPSTFPATITDQSKIDADYKYWRLRICYSLFIGYAVFYFTRKSFTYAAPAMAAELALTKGQIGLLGSVLYITYGISKFLSGVMSDQSNPRFFMAIGLILTGFLNILFGLSSEFWLFVLFWGLNGCFQAWGWPACTKSLTFWFAQKERGLWYSIISTSHNVGGAIISVLAVFSAMHFGWRYAMFIPAGISIVMGLWLINRLVDVPQSLGLPPVEHKNKPIEKFTVETCDVARNNKKVLPAKEIILNHVLNNKYVWIFAISYFFVYVVRTAVSDWSIFYLQEVKGLSEMVAGFAISGFEFGGLLGMIAAGWGSDYFFKGNRVPVMVLSAFGLILAAFGLWLSPANAGYLDVLLIGLIGFFVFGPQMIVGLAAAEFVDKRAASASNGFAGTLGYFGAAVACGAIGYAIDIFGWQGFYWSLIVSSVLIFVLLIPFWHVQSEEKPPSTGKPVSVATT